MLPRIFPSAVVAITFGLLLFSPINGARAQGSPEAANQQAYSLYLAGDYEKAASAYETVLENYPTAAIVPNAQLQLGYTYFFLAEYAKAEDILKKFLDGPPAPPALNQAARSLLPQVLSAKASALEPGNSARKTGFEAAIKGFTDFLKAFPQSAETESVVYGRALANFQLGNYDAAIKDLEANIDAFGSSSTITQSRNLLALAYATEGSQELNKGDATDREAAFADYNKAIEILKSIIEARADLTLINDAQFQLGEILFNLAAFSDEEARPPLYEEALTAYRSVLPKEEIVALQTKRVASFPELRKEALKAGDQDQLERLNVDNERELKRLSSVQSKADQTTPAMLKMAQIFFNQGRLNAARVLLSHLSPFLTADGEKKTALYYNTMTYAMQNVADKAVPLYDEFQSSYKADPIAQNLPLVIGNLYLSANDPQKAADYFDESLTIYPDGRFAGLSAVSRATALSRLGKADEAFKTFQDFLAKNPNPAEGVVAQMGLAGILKDTAKWDEAIAAYQTAIETYPKMPQIVEAEFWIAFATQQKGDNAAAIPLFNAFIADNSDSNLMPTALYSLATAQLGTNDQAAGIATLAKIADEYPDSRPAPFTYFQRAQLLAAEGKQDEMLELMKTFIEKYPEDDKLFFAYDTIANAALTAGDPATAIETYLDFSTKNATNPRAPEALLKIAALQRSQAERLGRFGAMPASDQATYRANVDAAIATGESLIKQFPDSPQVATALTDLLAAQRLLVSAEIKQPADIESYFRQLATASAPAVGSKALFTLAGYVAENDPDAALEIMDKAYDPALVYSATDLDTYGLALLDGNEADAALAIFEKIDTDYPVPPGTAPAGLTPEVYYAQAIALFGKGRVAQVKGEDATQFFAQLTQLYPASPKVLEARFGEAESLVTAKKYDEALPILTQVVRDTNATAELRAKSMLLMGDVYAEQGNLESAIDSYIKIAQFYAGVPKQAAQGLWRGGQLLEEQASTLTDPAAKTRAFDNARRSYQDLVSQFPNSEHAAEAKSRLAALGQP